jgi:hypothetical protein
LVDKLNIIRWMGYMALMGDRRGACMVLVGHVEEKRLLGKISVGK